MSYYIKGYRARGLGAKPLLANEIQAAQSISKSACDCARKLRVSLPTYMKYAKMYGLYEKCLVAKNGRLPGSFNDPKKSKKYPIEDILAAKPFPKLTKEPWRVREKLVRAGIKEDKCDICGENEQRQSDGKRAIIIAFKDGNKTNTRLNNIEFVCYNCCFKYYGPLSGKQAKSHNLTFPIKKIIPSNEMEVSLGIVSSFSGSIVPPTSVTSSSIDNTENKITEPDISNVPDEKVDPSKIDLSKL